MRKAVEMGAGQATSDNSKLARQSLWLVSSTLFPTSCGVPSAKQKDSRQKTRAGEEKRGLERMERLRNRWSKSIGC